MAIRDVYQIRFAFYALYSFEYDSLNLHKPFDVAQKSIVATSCASSIYFAIAALKCSMKIANRRAK